nr:MAG TPA: hypothetical protein [Bacteriophage sp.]
MTCSYCYLYFTFRITLHNYLTSLINSTINSNCYN